MRKYLCWFLSSIIISFVMIGAAPANNCDVAGGYIPWDKRDIGDKFGYLSWNDTDYMFDFRQARIIAPDSVGKLLGSVILETHPRTVAVEKEKNPKLTNKAFTQKCNLYKVKWIPSSYIIAAEYVGYEGYRLFFNDTYFRDDTYKTEKTGTFGELIQATGFEHNIVFGEKAFFTQSRKYFEKYSPESTTAKTYVQNPRTYSINGDKNLLNKFLALSDLKIKDAADPKTNIDPYAKIIMSLEFRQKYITGFGGVGMIYLYDDGTMRTKFDLIGEHYGNIGEDKVHEIVDYVINNCALISE